MPPRFQLLVAAAASLFAVIGCGGSSTQKTPPPPSEPVTIVAQPASASIPLDSSGTFTVQVEGTPPFQYQWSKNGDSISGATTASYTTPPIELGDTGTQYTVTVSNSVNSVTSAVATVTVGPRSPKPGDLRFKLIGSQALDQWTNDGPASLQFTFQPAFSSAFADPLFIGDQACSAGQPYPNCGWTYDVFYLPSGGMPLSVSFKAGYIADFDADLKTLNTADAVIQSLDFQTAAGAYGSEWLSIQGGQFDLIQRTVSAGLIASTVASDAAQSRVITAVSFDASGQAHLMSYGWQGDTTTVYDTEVSIVAPQDVVNAASNLGSAGFIITAFGGDDTDGYVLVGTKVHGDTLPRAVQAYPQSNLGGRAWMEVADVTWLEYTSSGSISSQGYEFVSEQ